MSETGKTAIGLATANVLDSLAASCREKTRLSRLSQRNAEWRAGLPKDIDEVPDTSINLAATLTEILQREEDNGTQSGIEGNSTGETGGGDAAGSSQGNSGGGDGGGSGSGADGQGHPGASGGAAGDAASTGPDPGSLARTDTGRSEGPAGGAGQGDSGKASTWGPLIRKLIASGVIGSALAGGWLGRGFFTPEETPPPAVQQPQPESLLQWLEDHNYHLPPE